MKSERIALVMTAAGVPLLLLAAGCGQQERVAAKPSPVVRAYTVALQSAADESRYSGSVEPVAKVDLGFQTAGVVEAIHQVRGLDGRARAVEAGDPIAAGVVLARLRATEYRARTEAVDAQIAEANAALAASKAQIVEAQAAVRQAGQDWQRAQRLFETQAMTRAEFDAARMRFETAEARVRAAEAQESSIAARLKGAQALRKESGVSLGDTSLVAPFAGVLVQRRTERGAQAGPGTAVFTLADLARVKVSFYVPDRALANFPAGAPVHIVAEALAGEQWAGRVQSVAPSADVATRSFRVEALVENPGLRLREGMVVAVTNRKTESDVRPVVPVSALVRLDDSGETFAVLAIGRDNRIERRRVVLGALAGNDVTVREGLRPGERIVREAVARLNEGEIVQVIP